MSESDDEEEYQACMDAVTRFRLAQSDQYLTAAEEGSFIAGWDAAEARYRPRPTPPGEER